MSEILTTKKVRTRNPDPNEEEKNGRSQFNYYFLNRADWGSGDLVLEQRISVLLENVQKAAPDAAFIRLR